MADLDVPQVRSIARKKAGDKSWFEIDLNAFEAILDEYADLRTRLAEVEAERDRYRADYTMTALENGQLNSGFWGAIEERDAAEARLAAVLAVEEGNVCPHGFEPGEPGCGCYMCRVRAAAEGDDRG